MRKNFDKILYFVSLCAITIAGYGYVLTHGTCGIDDISIDLYFEKGIGVAIGRWPYYLINKVIPIAKYTPFIGDFITVLLLMAAATVWCILFYKMIPEKISVWAYILFAALFMNYSMNADVFVFYLQNGLGWVHLFSVLSLFLFYNLYNKNSIKLRTQVGIRISVFMMLTLAISFYESAANIFLSGVFLVILIDLCCKKENSCFRGKRFGWAMFFTVRYLLYAMFARRMMRAVIMRIYRIPAYTFYRSATNIDWITKGNIKEFFAQIISDYFAMATVYYPIFLFVLCSIAFGMALLYLSWEKRDLLLAVSGIGFYFSMFALCVIQGDALEYRACQIFTIFVAFVFFVIAIWLSKFKKQVKIVGGLLIIIAILYSTYDMNRWFALDYKKTEYEMGVIDRIAADLNSGKYNVQEKPVAFVGDFELPEEIYGKYSYSQNNISIIDWSVKAFAMHCGYNVPIRQLFEYRGYEFLWPDNEMVKRVIERYYPLDWDYYSYTYIENYTENYGGKAQYPKKGYIEETEDCIIVRL